MRTELALTAAAIAAAAPVVGGAANADEPRPYWQRIGGCGHGHRLEVAVHGLERRLRNHIPVSAGTRAHVTHLRRCTLTRRDRRQVARRWRALRAWRMSYAHRWPITFNRLPSYDRAWAWSTGACESGNNPATATGNGFYGAFQFVPSTWWAAGGTGMPNQHSWHYQAVIAVRWMHVAGAGQWPVCGH